MNYVNIFIMLDSHGILLRQNMPQWPFFLISTWLCIIFTFYLAPGKDFIADLMVAMMLATQISKLVSLKKALMPLIPLLTWALFICVLGIFQKNIIDPFLSEIMIGLMPYLLLYINFLKYNSIQNQLLSIIILLIPGLIHLVFMYLDVFGSIINAKIHLFNIFDYDYFQNIKDSVRVGRTYLSMAMIHLLFAGLLIASKAKSGSVWSKLGHVVSALAILSLALLDARSAYVSLIIGGGLLFMGAGGGMRHIINSIQSVKLVGRIVVGCSLIVVMAIGFKAGENRWRVFTHSVITASHDVCDSEVELSQRYYVDNSIWDEEIKDFAKCIQESQFRCSVDQSAYLRTAWLLTAIQSLIDHPWGIGYSKDYMARLWGVAGETKKYQRSDSYLVRQIVQYGFLGMLPLVLLTWGVLRTLKGVTTLDASTTLIILAGLILVCFGRELVDLLSLGLWKYFMALYGSYYGLLHANEFSAKAHS